jgi:hypothetical protein
LEPGEATKTWLHLPFESREGLQLRLHTRSRCNFHCLAGLRPEPFVEPEPEPSQTGPYSLMHCSSAESCIVPIISKNEHVYVVEISLVFIYLHGDGDMLGGDMNARVFA